MDEALDFFTKSSFIAVKNDLVPLVSFLGHTMGRMQLRPNNMWAKLWISLPMRLINYDLDHSSKGASQLNYSTNQNLNQAQVQNESSIKFRPNKMSRKLSLNNPDKEYKTTKKALFSSYKWSKEPP